MKVLLKLFDAVRPTFTTGALKRLHPAYDAIDSFLFTVPDRSEVAPHVRGPMNLKRYMSVVIVTVMPLVLLSIYCFGWRMAVNLVLTYATGLTIECLFAMVKKDQIHEGFFVTGLLYPLILPPNLDPGWVVLGIAFGVLVGKELFGGTGRNLFNPALVGRCFLLIGAPKPMSAGWVAPAFQWPGRLMQFSGDAITGATPLSLAKQANFAPVMDLVSGNTSGSAGEMCVILIVLAAVMLIVTGVGSWRTIFSTLLTFTLLSVILMTTMPASFGLIDGAKMDVGFGDTVVTFSTATTGRRLCGAGWLTLWHLLAGGLLFGTVFMATDPVTAPFSKFGKWIFGAIIGASALLIRHLTGYVEGMMFAILLGNIFAPILDEIAVALHIRSLRNEG